MSVAGQKFHDLIRQFIPAFKDDVPRSDQMNAIAEYLMHNDPQVEFYDV
jgi:histidine ammonia-lyase